MNAIGPNALAVIETLRRDESRRKQDRIAERNRRTAQRKNRPVISNVGHRFESATKAAKAICVSRAALCYAIRRGTRCKGYYWTFADVAGVAWKIGMSKAMPVKAIGRGRPKLYATLSAAAAAIGVTRRRLELAVKSGERVGGLRWKRESPSPARVRAAD
jgi:hypothetical protein